MTKQQKVSPMLQPGWRQKIGKMGGKATLKKHGPAHFAALARKLARKNRAAQKAAQD